jgi:hypothetical protein
MFGKFVTPRGRAGGGEWQALQQYQGNGMSDENARHAAAANDDAMERALEIHRRLTREYNWDFMGIRGDGTPSVIHPPKSGDERDRHGS